MLPDSSGPGTQQLRGTAGRADSSKFKLGRRQSRVHILKVSMNLRTICWQGVLDDLPRA